MVEDERHVGRRLGLGRRDPVSHRLLRLGANRLGHLVGQDPRPPQIALVAADAFFLAFLFDALEVDVGLRVVGRRVRRGAVADGLDERRPVACPRSLDRLARRLVDGEDVKAVHPHPGIPYPTALSARVSARVCASTGVEIAQPLLLQKRTRARA